MEKKAFPVEDWRIEQNFRNLYNHKLNASEFDLLKIGNVPWIDVRESTYGALCNGINDDSGAIKQAVDDCPINGYVLVPGPITRIDHAITINKAMTLRVQGQLKLTANNQSGLVMGASHSVWTEIGRIKVDIDELLGTDEANGQIGIHMRNCVHSEFRIGHAHGLDSVVKFEQWHSSSILGENNFHFNIWHDCNYGLYVPGTTTVWAEGNDLYGGAILNCDTGLYFGNGAWAGGCSLIGCFDQTNAGKPSSVDYVNNMASQLGNLILSRDIRVEKCTFSVEDRFVIPAPYCYEGKFLSFSSGSPITVLDAHCYGAILGNGSSGDMHFDLPASKKNMKITFYVSNGQTITIDPYGTEQIYILTGSPGDYLQSDAAYGTYMTLFCNTPGSWIPLDYRGTWTEE